jgi:tRNA U34 5-methylaminomethyl-2-thiouridine-forming methyltransferase MnmC
MQRKLIVTGDGSHSIQIPEWQVSYHSKYGAIRESLHVFIEAGLKHWFHQHPAATNCIIFEMGFGTGLNALLTLLEAQQQGLNIVYESAEAYPLEPVLIDALNYCDALQRPDLKETFHVIHSCPWNMAVPVTADFTLKKVQTDLQSYSTDQPVNLIYYDAFAPKAQPRLWTTAIFQQLFNMLVPGGILVTYCSKGAVRRAMQAARFTVENLPGPPGKREMIRAIKPFHEKE